MIDVKQTLNDASERMEMATMYLGDELQRIRAGRAMIRLNLPQPTEERRRDLVKQCNKIGERTKVEIRNVRSDIKEKLKKAIKDGLSEDNEKDAEDSLQKIHDKFIKQVDTLLEDKQKEIMTV